MPAHASSSDGYRRKRSGRNRKSRWRWVGALFVLIALGLIGAGGWNAFRNLRQNRAVDRARDFLKAGDYIQASMSATYALQQNPTDPDAMRIMAETCAAQGLQQEMVWREKLAQTQPEVADHWYKWAKAALTYGEVRTAQQAMNGLPESEKSTAAYHEIAGRIAAMLRKGKELETNVAEAARLDPDNATYQLQLAALRLGSERRETREVARDEIERMAANAKISRPALLVLIRDALWHGDSARALAFSQKLNALPEVNFEDRMSYLRLLRQLNRREFWWLAAQMQAEAADSENEIPALMTYFNKSGMPGATVIWSRRLDETVRANSLVSVTLAEAALMQKNWESLKSQVKLGKWKDLEFQRLALLARVAREEGDLPGAAAQWKAAMAAAAGRPDDLATLARLAMTWKWVDEANAALWQIARGPARQMPALQSLSRNYRMSGDTRELLNVANRMLEVDSENLYAKNNVAYLSLLLEADRERAHALAKEVYLTSPRNPAFVSTYALSLHLVGKSAGGLKLLQTTLPPQSLETPDYAFSYGILLAALNKREEAERYLALAEKSALMLAEEKALLARAREWISKP